MYKKNWEVEYRDINDNILRALIELRANKDNDDRESFSK